MNIYKLASTINIEVFGVNHIGSIEKMSDSQRKKLGIQLDKDGKIISIPPKWQTNKKNRFNIRKGENKVPEWVLEVPIVKSCVKKGKMTVGEMVKGTEKPKKKAPTKKKGTKKKPPKPTEITAENTETEDGLPKAE